MVQPPGFYGENGIETRFGVRATRVDAAEKVVKLDSGASGAYDKLLIATGERNRRFSIPGLDLKGVHDLHTVADCEHIRTQIAPGRKAVVVEMGFLGSEVAASLRQSGVDVVVVERKRCRCVEYLAKRSAG